MGESRGLYGERKAVYKVLVSKPEVKTPPAKPGRRLGDSI
jgi:hypothetical protein